MRPDRIDSATLSEFRARVRADLRLPERAPEAVSDERFLDVDPAVRGSVPAGTVWYRFGCLAVAGGPCPAWRLSQCHGNCWRRPKPAVSPS